MRVSTIATAVALSGLAQADALASVSAASAAISSRLSSFWDAAAAYVPAVAAKVANAAPGGASSSSSSPSHNSGKGQLRSANLTATNWEAELSPANSTRPWLVLVTGGNTTCGGRCGQLDAAWRLASGAALVERSAAVPNLGWVDCERNRLLCATWGAEPAEAWWIEPEVREIKAADTVAARVTQKGAETEGEVPLQTKAKGLLDTRRDVYVVRFNTSTVGADDITRLYRKGEYKNYGGLLESEGFLSRHPFDSQLARNGLNIYLGYVYFAIGMVPSWTFVMILSITMRMFLQNRAVPKETREQKAAREKNEKYTPSGKVRGAPPGDARSSGPI